MLPCMRPVYQSTGLKQMPYPTFLDTLSSPRSGVYKRVFRTQTAMETAGAVLWAQYMTTAMQALIHSFEVVLRNRVHVSLSRQASEVHGPVVDSFPWYDHRQVPRRLEGETYSRIEALLCDRNGIRLSTLPSPDRVIASLPFGVWPNILDAQLPTPKTEVRTFSDVFPNHPAAKAHWRHRANHKSVVAVLKDLRAWRNRLSHCKPLWTQGWFRRSPHQHWTDMLSQLKSRRADALNVLGWMCPSTATVYQGGFAGRLFDALATDDAVFAHIQQPLEAGNGPSYVVSDAEALAAYKRR